MAVKFAGIVGLGTTGRLFVNAIKAHQGIELRVICDNDSRKLNGFADVAKYTDFREMIKTEKLDIVALAVPNNLHYSFIKLALENNVNVICEKPLVFSSTEAEELFDIARKRGLVLKTAFHRRYNMHIVPIMKNIHDIGRVSFVRATYFENIDEHSCGERWYYDKKISGGGVIMDNGTNMIDLLLHLVGSMKLNGVNVRFGEKDSHIYDDGAVLSFESNGARILLELDWSYHGEKKEVIIFTDKKTIYVDFLAGFTWFKSSLDHEYTSVISDFLDDIRANRMEPGSDIAVISLVEDIYSSINSPKV